MKKLSNIGCFCTLPDHSSNHDYNVRLPVQTLLQTAIDRYRQSTLRAKLPRSRSEKPDVDPVKRRRSSSNESVFPVRKTGCQYQSHTWHQSESSMNANKIGRQHSYIKGSRPVMTDCFWPRHRYILEISYRYRQLSTELRPSNATNHYRRRPHCVKLIEANDVRLLSAKDEVRQARIGSRLSKVSSDLLTPF